MRCTRAHEIVNRGFFITHLRSFGGAKNIAAALRTSMPAVTIPHPLVILRSQRLGPCKLTLYALLVFFLGDLGFTSLAAACARTVQ